MCGPKFRTPPYNKTREDANLLPISKPFVSWRALFKTNQWFLQCKLGCISTFWQPIDKPKDKFIGNYAFCKKATYIKTNFQIKKGPLQNLRVRKSTLSGPHIPLPTFPLSTPRATGCPSKKWTLPTYWWIWCYIKIYLTKIPSFTYNNSCIFKLLSPKKQEWIWWNNFDDFKLSQ